MFEDGTPQAISHFASEDVPLELVVAIDISGSMGPSMPKLKTAVKEFLTTVPAQNQVTLLAFNDINPQAPTHVLIVPKRHIESLTAVTDADDPLVGMLVRRAAAIAEDRGIAASGYRTVFNTNRDAGQTVFHLHLHLLGGRALAWPPG